MAAPRVFVSSTCYDLSEVRDSLVTFIKAFGFEPILSDRGDIFYHPDLHTHESCVSEIKNCELFILIVGGRFGGQYVYDITKSIVNAEYFAAKQCNIPVFTFVKEEVLQNHRVYKENKSNSDVIKNMKFPAIDKQKYAINIFEFIDEVHYSKSNNGLFPFTFSREIQDLLRKQWAGMFFDFLIKRQQESEISIVNQLLNNLSLASKKSEELIENIYKHLDATKAEIVINDIDKVIEATKFFDEIGKRFHTSKFIDNDIDNILQNETGTWFDFVLSLSNDFFVQTVDYNSENMDIDILCHESNNYCIGIGGEGFENSKEEQEDFGGFDALYKKYKQLSTDQKRKALLQYILKN